MFQKTEVQKVELQNAKLSWRKTMRNKYGLSWTKRSACNMHSDGSRRMN